MPKETMNENTAKKGGSKILVICIGVIVILVVAMVVLVYAYIQSQKEQEVITDDGKVRGVVVNEGNAENIANDFIEQSKTPQGYYEVKMTNDWRFAYGDSVSENAYVENAETNTNAVYFDLLIGDDERLLYSSPVIPVGSHLDEIKLDEVLSAGEYNCVLNYHLLDENYEKTISTVRVGVKVIIQK